jgi:hypothetical protein
VRLVGGWNKIDEILWRTFRLEVLNLSTSLVIIIIIIIIIITTAFSIKCVFCELGN